MKKLICRIKSIIIKKLIGFKFLMHKLVSINRRWLKGT